MRTAALLLATLALSGCAVGGGTKTTTVSVTRTVTTQAAPKAGPMSGAENARYFGTPISITRVGAKRYLLVLEPRFYLVGVTANVASAAQQGISCPPLQCPGAEDGRLVVPAGSEKLTFILPATAKGTVLTLSGGKMRTTTVTAAQLAGLVAGGRTPKLLEPLDSGLWLAVDVDMVTSFEQQFQP